MLKSVNASTHNQPGSASADRSEECTEATGQSVSNFPDSGLRNRAGRVLDRLGLHWIHWVIIGLVLYLVVHIYRLEVDEHNQLYRQQFERTTDQIVDQIHENLQRYEDILWSGASAVQASTGPISRGQWHKFTQSLRLTERYPAIHALSIVAAVDESGLDEFLQQQRLIDPDFELFPEGSSALRLPVIHIEPYEANQKVIGLDNAQNPARRATSLRARDSGQAQLTEPVELVQHPGEPSLIMFVPIYRKLGVPPSTERVELFSGMVSAPIIMQRMISTSLGNTLRSVQFSVIDQGMTLYDDDGIAHPNYDPNPLFTRHLDIGMLGRSWSIAFRSTLELRQNADRNKPTAVLFAGLSILVLVIALFAVLVRSDRQAKRYIVRLNDAALELQAQRAADLKNSNDELERFAYVVAHDLKAPLNGIHSLTSFLKEDLDEVPMPAAIKLEVDHHLSRVHEQAERMRRLIDGIMEHALVDSAVEPEQIDLDQLVVQVATSHNLPVDRLIRPTALPVIDSYRIPLQQVMENLIGNAIKYHPTPETAIVTITAESVGNHVRIAVSDNGTGIEPSRHLSIFDVFNTGGRQDPDSTGIGLSIVKRAVESYGGDVKVESAEGGGAKFVFTWPTSVSESIVTTPPAKAA